MNRKCHICNRSYRCSSPLFSLSHRFQSPFICALLSPCALTINCICHIVSIVTRTARDVPIQKHPPNKLHEFHTIFLHRNLYYKICVPICIFCYSVSNIPFILLTIFDIHVCKINSRWECGTRNLNEQIVGERIDVWQVGSARRVKNVWRHNHWLVNEKTNCEKSTRLWSNSQIICTTRIAIFRGRGGAWWRHRIVII